MITLLFIALSGIGLYVLLKPPVKNEFFDKPYQELPAFSEKTVPVRQEPVFEKPTVLL